MLKKRRDHDEACEAEPMRLDGGSVIRAVRPYAVLGLSSE